MSGKISQEHLPFYVKSLQKVFKTKESRSRASKNLTIFTLIAAILVGGSTSASADDGIGVSNIGFGSSGTLSMGSGSTASAWDLVGSGYDLSQVDPLSGLVTGQEFGQTLSAEYSMQADLISNNQMAIDTAQLANQARIEAAAKKAADEEAKRKAAGASAAAVGDPSADTTGCPVDAPANTLRDGSSSVGVAEICARSVSLARNPQAAAAIKYTLNNLGKPYSQPKRNQDGWYDCSSYTSRAYQAAGVAIAPPGQNAPTTRSMRVSRWAVKIPFGDLRPGDLVQPTNGHVAMQLADGWVVHTNRPGDVSHVRKAYTSAYWAAYVDPALV